MIYKKTKSNEKERLYYRSMGKIFRVVAIVENAEEDAAYCKAHPDVVLIGHLGSYRVLAECYGEKIRT